MQGVHGIKEDQIALGQLASSFCTSVKPTIDKLGSPWSNSVASDKYKDIGEPRSNT